MIRRPGSWFDVCGAGAVYVSGAELVCELEATVHWRQPLTQAILYLRAATRTSDGVTRCIAQAHEDGVGAQFLGQGVAVTLPYLAFGQLGCLIAADGTAWRVHLLTSPRTYRRLRVSDAGAILTDEPFDLSPKRFPDGTSQGWLQEHGLDLVFTDEDRAFLTRLLNGSDVRVTLPTQEGWLIAGQHGAAPADPPNQLALVDLAAQTISTIAICDPFEPRIATLTDGRVIVGSRLKNHECGYLIGPPWPPYVAVEPIPDVTVSAIGRRFWAGPIFATSNDPASRAIELDGQVVGPGNLEVPVRPTDAQLAAITRAIVADPADALRRHADGSFVIPDARLLAIAGDTSGPVLAEAVAAALERQKPIHVYHDAEGYPGALQSALAALEQQHPGLTFWLGPQWYQGFTEDNESFMYRMHDETAALATWGRPIFPVVGAFSRNGKISPANLRRQVVLYARVARGNPEIIGVMWFATLRADGVAAHPFLVSTYDQLMAGIPGTPAWPVWHGHEPPPIDDDDPPIDQPPLDPPKRPPTKEEPDMSASTRRETIAATIQGALYFPWLIEKAGKHPDFPGLEGDRIHAWILHVMDSLDAVRKFPDGKPANTGEHYARAVFLLTQRGPDTAKPRTRADELVPPASFEEIRDKFLPNPPIPF